MRPAVYMVDRRRRQCSEHTKGIKHFALCGRMERVITQQYTASKTTLNYVGTILYPSIHRQRVFPLRSLANRLSFCVVRETLRHPVLCCLHSQQFRSVFRKSEKYNKLSTLCTGCSAQNFIIITLIDRANVRATTPSKGSST